MKKFEFTKQNIFLISAGALFLILALLNFVSPVFPYLSFFPLLAISLYFTYNGYNAYVKINNIVSEAESERITIMLEKNGGLINKEQHKEIEKQINKEYKKTLNDKLNVLLTTSIISIIILTMIILPLI